MNNENLGGVISGGQSFSDLNNAVPLNTGVDSSSNAIGNTTPTSNIVGGIPVVPVVNDTSSISTNNVVGTPTPVVEQSSPANNDGVIAVSTSTVVPGAQPVDNNNLANSVSTPTLSFDLPGTTSTPTVDSSANYSTLNNSLANNSLGSLNASVSSVDNSNMSLSQNSGIIGQGINPAADVVSGTTNLNDGTTISSVGLVSSVDSSNNVTSVSNDVVQNNNQSSDGTIVSVGKYLGHMFLFMIPIVGLIMMIVKMNDKNDKNISNYAKAQLLFAVIFCVLSVLIGVVSFLLFGNSAANSIGDGSDGGSSYIIDYE